jgi:hypothetical protein
VTWRSSVTMSIGGEVTPGRENGGDGASWDDTNFTGLKNKKNHAVDSVAINRR